MSEWQPISTAPKNQPGESYGPWVLVFSKYDHGIYMARWECRGDTKGWFGKNNPNSFFSHNVTHWMIRPDNPKD